VANNRVSILADRAELATEINKSSAQAELDALIASDPDADESSPARRAAEVRVEAAQKAS
jgi:F0F1-type ATP synthase epsilon subunit